MSIPMELRKFVTSEFVFGIGARKLVGRYAVNYGARKVLVVTDPGIIEAGWVDQLLDSLHQENIAYIVFADNHPNPRDSEVMAGAELYLKEACNLIIAIGGGSPMDCAKGIGIVSSNHQHILSFEGVDEVPIPAPPLICIPTTAGTAADISQFAIINDINRKVKIAIISKTVVPDAALIDPITTTTMDAYLTACTGMDALTHAIEAYVSNAQSPITDLHALEAIRLIWANLLQVIDQPDNLELRSQMMLASLHAGLAFSNASLGAVHAMAHSLGGYLNLPHGECNALLLEHVVAYNFEATPERYIKIAESMGLDLNHLSPKAQKSNLVNALARLRQSAGINKSLQQIGVTPVNIPELAKKAIMDPCMVTNPRSPIQSDIETIYAAAL
jgi:alcohol dehydrogenase